MKIGNVTVDAADVGNVCLIAGTGVAVYGTSTGNPILAVEALAVGAALKAVASLPISLEIKAKAIVLASSVTGAILLY